MNPTNTMKANPSNTNPEPKEEKQREIIAIDIAKENLQIQTARETFSLENGAKGFQELLGKLPNKENAFVVFEATGGYERPLAEYLRNKKIPFSIINPSKLRAFAKSDGIKAKTDLIDAKMIYRFAKEKILRPASVGGEQQRILSEYLDERSRISVDLTRAKNQLDKNPCKEVAKLIKGRISFLEKTQGKVEKLIRELVKKDGALANATEIIQSIQGAGEVTAWTIAAYLPEITEVNRNQLAALAGLAPYNSDSGSVTGKRFIQGGRRKVRRVLYMAALTGAQCNPVLSEYVERLVARGKAKKCVLVAAMRKLLLHIQSELKKSDFSVAN